MIAKAIAVLVLGGIWIGLIWLAAEGTGRVVGY